MDYEKAYKEALERAKSFQEKYGGDYAGYIFPELRESEDERIRKFLIEMFSHGTWQKEWPFGPNEIVAWLEKQKERGPLTKDEEYTLHRIIEYLEDETCPSEWISLLHDIYCLPYEKQKEQKPIIQDVELNDAVYDYVRDHFIAGADFTPEYIKKLMENAFFAGVDYYLLKQEFESSEPDTNVEKVIEDVIRVYGKTQGEWVGGYDVDTLIVNLRRAFNKKEQKPAEWSEADEEKLKAICTYLRDYSRLVKLGDKLRFNEYCDFLESLRPQGSKDSLQTHWKPSEEQMKALQNAVALAAGNKVLAGLYEQLKSL